LKEVNNIKNDRHLKLGTVLAIPLPKDIASSKVPFNYYPDVKGLNFGAIKEQIAKIDRSRTTSKNRNITSGSLKGKEKLVYHVKPGDTIGHIAEWYGVRASDIRNWNDISYGNYIYAGQELVIWVLKSRADSLRKIDNMEFSEKQNMLKKEVNSNNKILNREKESVYLMDRWIRHKVKRGETLEKIARIYDVSVKDLMRWNGIKTHRINAGQVLQIYDTKSQSKESEEPLVGAEPRSNIKTKSTGIFNPEHKVKKGESLYTIARKYNVDFRSLKKYNNLRNEKIYVGQLLKIPSN